MAPSEGCGRTARRSPLAAARIAPALVYSPNRLGHPRVGGRPRPTTTVPGPATSSPGKAGTSHRQTTQWEGVERGGGRRARGRARTQGGDGETKNAAAHARPHPDGRSRPAALAMIFCVSLFSARAQGARPH